MDQPERSSAPPSVTRNRTTPHNQTASAPHRACGQTSSVVRVVGRRSVCGDAGVSSTGVAAIQSAVDDRLTTYGRC